MVISIYVDIETGKFVECVWKSKSSWYEILSEYWKKVCCSDNGIEVDDGGEFCAIFMYIRFNYPHAGVLIWPIIHTWKPIHKCTWIFVAVVRKWKEESHVSDIEALHTISRGIGIDKYRIMSLRAFSPWLHCLYVFAAHAANTRDVTERVKGGNSRRITCNFAIECKESGMAYIKSGVRVCLVMYKLFDKIGEVRLLDINSDVFRVNSSHYKDDSVVY